MTYLIQRIPTARTVIIYILWFQIGIAILTFFISQKYYLLDYFKPDYKIVKYETLPLEKQTKTIKDRKLPSLKRSVDYFPKVDLPDNISKQLSFRKIFLEEFGYGILLSGSISINDTKKFITFINENKDINFSFIALHSPGGIVHEALMLGKEVRDRNLDTMLPSNSFCYSACPYIMAGGVNRIFSFYSLLGVHQHYYKEENLLSIFTAVKTIQDGQAKTFKHLKKMGIDINIMEHILSTPPDEIYILSPEELETYNFATMIIKTK